MALPRNSLLLSLVIVGWFAAPAAAEDDPYYYGSRSDKITLGAGDAVRANIAIQHQTPWPSYVNDTHIRTPARQSLGALEMMFKRYEPSTSQTQSTVIDVKLPSAKDN
jgi:hypothetical protein